MVNFRTNVIISVYRPTIVACDIGLGITVHYSGKYFTQVNNFTILVHRRRLHNILGHFINGIKVNKKIRPDK
jgi:hypothetical protein